MRIQWRDKSYCGQLRVSTPQVGELQSYWGWRVVILTTWPPSIRHLAPVPHMVNIVTWHDDTRSCIHSTYHYTALNTRSICHDIAIITSVKDHPGSGISSLTGFILGLRSGPHSVNSRFYGKFCTLLSVAISRQQETFEVKVSSTVSAV